jgi:hypothetical protein
LAVTCDKDRQSHMLTYITTEPKLTRFP